MDITTSNRFERWGRCDTVSVNARHKFDALLERECPSFSVAPPSLIDGRLRRLDRSGILGNNKSITETA